MKTNKAKYFTVLAMLLALAVTLSAGGDKDKMAKLKAELNLTDAQVAQLEQKFEALKPYGEKFTALKTGLESLEKAATPDQKAIDAKKAELMAFKKEYKEKANAIYRSVLTKEQFAKLEAMWTEYDKNQAAKKN